MKRNLLMALAGAVLVAAVAGALLLRSNAPSATGAKTAQEAPAEPPAPLSPPATEEATHASAGSALSLAPPEPDESEAERLKAAQIRVLVAAGLIGKARGETSRYLERFPNGANAAELTKLTGVHRTTR